MKETLKQAAVRYGLKSNTLYRRLERLIQSGEISLTPADYVGPSIYLESTVWDQICEKTKVPGRPRKL
jgi:hypothetical protein